MFAASGWPVRVDLVLDAIVGGEVFPPECLAATLPHSCLPGYSPRAAWVPPTTPDGVTAWRTRLWMRLGPTGFYMRAPADNGEEALFVRAADLREDVLCVGYFEFPVAVSAAVVEASDAPRYKSGEHLLSALPPSRPSEFLARLIHARPGAFVGPPWVLGLMDEEVEKMRAG
jgi:hypothetical protein